MTRRGMFSALVAAALLSTGSAAVEQGDIAPQWSATDFSGRPIEFPQVLDDDPAVVIFWATWCSYCRAFMPYLEQIQADYADAGISIIGINAKERGRGDPVAYVDDLGFPIVAVAEGDAIAAAYAVEYIPGLFVIDGNGNVAYRRGWTDLPAGRTVAELWNEQVRSTLDRLID